MNYQDAARESEHKQSRLPGGDYSYEVYDLDSAGFFTALLGQDGWTVDRKKGRGNKISQDWEPVRDPALASAIHRWQAKQEERDVVIAKPWEAACLASPVNRCLRATRSGSSMVRDGARNTWTEMGMTLVRLSGPFKQFDGWEPMPDDHKFAEIDLAVEHNINLAGLAPRKAVPNPDAPAVEVTPETVSAAASIAQALATAIQFTAGDAQRGLVEQLVHLTKSVGWLLREDRAKYRTPKGA